MELEDVFQMFKIDPVEGSDKRMSIADAVRQFVHPKSFIHMGITSNLPFGPMYEITRQFWGTDAQLTLCGLGASMNAIVPLASSLFHEERLVAKIIHTYCGDIYPTPAPNKILQKIYKEKRVEIEAWSLLTLVLREFAGAQGMDFIEADSIAGTNIATDATADYRMIESPFVPGKQIGVISALKPDVTVVHALVADQYGNTIATAPLGEYLWGVLASKDIIVSVDKVVDTDFIRKYNHLVLIPGNRVSAVVEMPFGAHPAGNSGIPGVFPGYAEDYDFIVEWHRVSRPGEGDDWGVLKEWIDKWVLNTTPEQYLADLGEERLSFLRDVKYQPDYWIQRTREAFPNIDFSENYSSVDMMTVQTAREGVETILANKYATILAGQGFSNLAAWMAKKVCSDRGYLVELMAELGFYGYDPRPGFPYIFDCSNVPLCKQSAGIYHTLGHLVNGPHSNNIGFLGAGQVDKQGNINSTLAGDMYLVGSGGAADVCGGSKEVLLCINHHPMRLVDKVPYITGVGDHVQTLVTTMGVLKKQDGELTLTKIFPGVKETPEAAIKYIKRQTGWRLQALDEVEVVDPPTAEELAIIRLFDPNKYFLRETAL
ncbi:MAG TPA: CoA-transferase [Candidatus Lokiarchaeia archaeon]|nr:CoA-transferase [Candidatus Lokiarchaeia archaeon]